MLKVKDIHSSCEVVEIKSSNISDQIELPKSEFLNERYKYTIIDQGKNCLCISETTAALNEYLIQNDGHEFRKLSVAYLYYNVRNKINAKGKNVGAKPADIIDTIFSNGICEQERWTSIPEHIDLSPSEDIFLWAKSHIRDTIVEIIDPDINVIKYIIGYCKRPIVVSIKLSKKFYKCEGIIEPEIDKYSVKGHSILLVGYDSDCLICQNSWGTKWGNNGFGKLSYEYIKHFRSLWSLKKSIINCKNFENDT